MKPKYQWPTRAAKMLQGLASSCGDVAQLIDRPKDALALLGVSFPSINSTVLAYSWGLAVMVGEKKQTLSFADALAHQPISLPLETIHALMYRDPLKVEEVSFVSGASAWSRVKGPRILLAFLYGILIDLTSGRLQVPKSTY